MKKILLFLAVFIFLASLGWGQPVFYYTGEGGYGNWSDLNNWRDAASGGNIPTRLPGSGSTTDIVIINTTVWNMNIPGNLVLQELIINAGGSLVFNNNNLTVTNLTYNYSGQFVFLSANIKVNGTLELNGILDLSAGVNESSIDFKNLKLGNSPAGIRGNNASMNGMSVQVSPDSDTVNIIFNSVTDDLGNIDAGDRNITINIPPDSTVDIGNITSSGNITVNAGDDSTVNIGNISSGGNVTINAGADSEVDVSGIIAGGNVNIGGGSGNVNVNNNVSDTYEWIGLKNSDWNDPDNWDVNGSPGDGDPSYIIIIHVSSNTPVFVHVSSTGLECDTLLIQAGASLNMGAYNLTAEKLDNYGNLILAGSGSQKVMVTTSTANETVTYNASGTHFAGLTGFNHLVITNGDRTGVGNITVSGNFTLSDGSLNAASISVMGTANISADITTTSGTQTYSGNVTLGGTGAVRTLTGSTVTLGTIIGSVKSLTIYGNGVLIGGSSLGDLQVSGTFSLSGNSLTAESVNVTGTSTIAADITTTGGTQAYSGNVTLGGSGSLITLTGSTVTLGAVSGGGNSLTITGAGVLNGGSGINVLSVSGAADINANITTTGNQTYNGAVTLAGTRTLTSSGGYVNAVGIVTGTGITVNALQGITLANAANALTGNVTLNNTQPGTPTGNISFVNASSSISLSAVNNAAGGNITINNNDDISITSLKTNTGGRITVVSTTGEVTQTGAIETDDLTVLAVTDIKPAISSVVNNVSTSVNLTSNMGEISFNNGNTGQLLVAAKTINNKDISITQAGELEVSSVNGVNGIDAGSGKVTLKADGNVTQTVVINTSDLNVETKAGITLDGNNAIKIVSLKSTASSSAQGSITYNSNVGASNKLEVTAVTPGDVSITETTGAIDFKSITSGVNINLKAKTDIETKGINVTGIVNLEADGDITIGGAITAYQLVATAVGDVNVGAFRIEAKSTGNEKPTAAIYITADDFKVDPATRIIPGGNGGQLCLDLENHWEDLTPNVIDGPENVRWHQHFIDLRLSHLIYGILPASLNPVPSGYTHISANDIKTTFTLDSGYNVFIYDAVNTNTSGISFKTSGAGFIEFNGTNKFEKITLESGGGIRLVDTDITITEGFELTYSEATTLTSNSPPGAGSSIRAENITLNGITAATVKNLTLTSTSGDISVNGAVGTNTDPLGNITVVSADKASFTGAVFANSIAVTSDDTTIGANVTTTAAQTYTGAVTLTGTGTKTLEGTTVTLGQFTGPGAGLSLTITGNGVLNGGSGIGALTVSGNAAINADITTTGAAQAYNGAVTLGGAGSLITLTGTTVTLGAITGNGKSLTITGNGILNGGSGIGDLTIGGTFNLSVGTLNAAKVDVTGASTINENITTTGTQIYTGAVTLGDDVNFTGSAGSTIQFGNTVNGVTSARDLIITNANVVFNGAISTFIKNLNITAGTAVINASITTTGAQTYTGAVTLGGSGSLITLTASGSTVTLGPITGSGKSLTITGNGILNGGTNIGDLTINGNFNLASGVLSAAKVDVTGTSNIAGDITAAGNQTYTGAVIIDASGSISDKRTITSDSGDIIFLDTLGAADSTRDKIELIATVGKITVTKEIKAYQLIARAAGIVTVAEIIINSSNTEYEGLDAAIFIEADDFVVTKSSLPPTYYPIVPGGIDGQLCLVLNKEWVDTYDVVDGLENVRWHQHFVDLTGRHLVYGTVPSELLPLEPLPPGDYVIVPDDFIKTTFVLDSGKNVYINDANKTKTSGLVFITRGAGVIKFSGTNNFEKITLKTDNTGGINLVDTDITVTGGGFELNNSETLTLETDSALNRGRSSINAANITLNVITALNKEDLSLRANPTTGKINITGMIGTLIDPAGNITVVNANQVTLSGAIHANSISVTSTGTTIVADITAAGTQAYTGAVTLGGTGTRTLTGSTVTLGQFTGPGAGLSLTITGNGVLNGGSGINALSVSGNANINANITTTGTQIYTGTVTLGGAGSLITLDGTTVTLGTITGIGKSLTITGNGTLAGASGINVLSVSGTAAINDDINTTGNQTYGGAVTLGGSGIRTITSDNGSIEFKSTLTSLNEIKLSAQGGNITITGKTTAKQLLVIARGTVKVDEITIDPSTDGNEGENAAIYIEADTFEVTTTTPGSIVPGGRPVGAQWGQLCLVLNSEWTDTDGVVDGDEDMDPDNLHDTGYRWHQHIILSGKILYSFTEDSNGNGRLDRIRVQANVALNGDFSGFKVNVEKYTVIGYELVGRVNGNRSDEDSFYIYLTENNEFDGGNTPLWSVLENTTLANKAGLLVGDPSVDTDIKPIDTIPPRIVYTLTIPGYPQTYVQMSEPVIDNSTGLDISASFGSLSVQGMTQAGAEGLGYLFSLSGSFKVEDLTRDFYSPILIDGYFQMDNVVDKSSEPESSAIDAKYPPKYPLDWRYKAYGNINTNPAIPKPPYELLSADMVKELADSSGAPVIPNAGGSVIYRATDVLVSRAPDKTDSDNYFAWPVWARFKKSLNVPYAAGNDVFWGQQPTDTGIIWQFDGTNYLETSFIDSNEGLELQARINDNLTDAPVLFWTTSNIPAEYRNPQEATENKKTGGLWLPNVPSLFYDYVPLSDGINGKPADSSSSKLFNYDIAAGDIADGAKFEFIFRLSNVSDMFIARLDIPRGGAIPANWYTLVRPFIFEIHNIRRQRGGVTIMNNVINSNNKETAFIRYHLTRPGRVTVQIYTLDGTLVKSLRRNDQREAGEWTDAWDGTNNGGRAVARGMYFVRVVGPDIDEIRKIMVIK